MGPRRAFDTLIPSQISVLTHVYPRVSCHDLPTILTKALTATVREMITSFIGPPGRVTDWDDILLTMSRTMFSAHCLSLWQFTHCHGDCNDYPEWHAHLSTGGYSPPSIELRQGSRRGDCPRPASRGKCHRRCATAKCPNPAGEMELPKG